MTDSQVDKELLLGILAIKIGAVTRRQLVQATEKWAADRSISVGERLREEGLLSADELLDLAALVESHIAMHDGDSSAGLASAMPSTIMSQLAKIGDEDLTRHVTHASTAFEMVEHDSDVPAFTSAKAVHRLRFERLQAVGGLGLVSVTRSRTRESSEEMLARA